MEIVEEDKNGKGARAPAAAPDEPISNEGVSSPAPAPPPPPGYVEEMPEEFSEEVSVTPPSNDFECTDDEEEREDGDVELRGLIHSVVHNEVILEHLFGLCPPELLANFRLVSKLWQKESLPFLRASRQVKFDMRQGYGKLQRFLEFLEDPKNDCDIKPYRWIRLANWNFSQENDVIDLLSRVCVISITKLELWRCTLDGMDGLPKVVFDSFPNLQTFCMGRCTTNTEDEDDVEEEDLEEEDDDFEEENPEEEDSDVEEEDQEEEDGDVEDQPVQQENDDEEFAYWQYPSLKSLSIDLDSQPLPVPWLNLFSHFQYLTSLKLRSADGRNANVSRVIVEMLKAIQTIRSEDKRKLPLKHLDILHVSLRYQEELSLRVCVLLGELQLPLESLAMDFGGLTQLEQVKELLEPHGRTLKTLTALRNPQCSPYGQFPYGVRVDSLEELSISENIFGNMGFRQVAYESCPNLETLVVDGYCFSLGCRDLLNQLATDCGGFWHMEYPNVKVFTVKISGSPPDPKSWLELFSYFSNLSSLKLEWNPARYFPHSEDAGVGMLNAIQKIRSTDNRKLRLKHLEIVGSSCFHHLHYYFLSIPHFFQELQLPLESLAIDFEETELNPIHDILKVLGKTLKSLTIRRNTDFRWYKGEEILDVLKLVNLEEFRLPEQFIEHLVFRKNVYNCCPNLQTLELDGYRLSTENGPLLGMDPFLEEHLNLKFLTVDLSWSKKPLLESSWVELFRWFPNVTSLKLKPPKPGRNQGRETGKNNFNVWIVKMLTAIQTIQSEDQRKLPLKHLDIPTNSAINRFQREPRSSKISLLLRELQLPLESLAIDFEETELNPIHDILKVLGKTLKSLTIRRNTYVCWYKGEEILDLLQVDNLEELQIPEKFIGNIVFRKTVHKCCPNLQTLELDGYRLSTEHGPLMGVDPFLEEHPNLKFLTVDLSWSEKPLLESSWVELFRRFPNVTSLKLKPPKPGRNPEEYYGQRETGENNFNDWIVKVLTAIQTVRSEDQHKLPLKHLDILINSAINRFQGEPSSKISLLLRELQLPLESLAMCFPTWFSWDPEFYEDILETYGKTLINLAITVSKDSYLKADPLPEGPIDSLEELTISEEFLDIMKLCQIFYRCCPNLKALEVNGYCQNKINQIVSHESESGEDDKFYYVEYPNLKSLTVGISYEYLSADCESWMYLFYHFPNLTSIELSCPCSEDSASALNSMLDAMQFIRDEYSYKSQLKHLDIADASLSHPYYASYICRLFRELQLPLESLAMNFGRDVEPADVLEILKAHASTLRSLTVYDYSNEFLYGKFQFGVQLDKLEELVISRSDMADLNILNFTPNIQKLHVGGEGSQKSTSVVLQLNIRPSAFVTHLEELVINMPYKIHGIQELVERIPTVKKLSMHLNDYQFRLVCNAWRSLEHLTVFGYELTDEGVTGRKSQSENEEEKQCQPERPNITWLKDLTSFTLDVGGEAEDVYAWWRRDDDLRNYLTDASAFQGFLKLDSLQSLKLRCRCQMSDEAKLALKEKIPHCKIIDSKVGVGDDDWDSS